MSSNANLYNKITLPATSQPDNLGSKMYKGFSSISTSTENYNLFDFELIKQDILNHFNTRQGERLMNPTFGCVIWDLLFEPLTEDIKNIILQNVNTIINYDPRVKAESVIVTSYGQGIQLQLSFDQSNGLLIG